MAVSKQSIRNLEKAFENIFESDTGEIGNSLLYNDAYTYGEIVHVALMDEGYPESASYRTVGTSLEVKSNVGYDVWVVDIVTENDLNESEEIDKLADNDGELITFILNHLDRVDIVVEFIDSLEDYIDSEPPFEHFEYLFEQEFDRVYFEDYLESQPHLIKEHVDDAINQQSVPSHLSSDDIDIGIVKLNLSSDSADVLYEHYDEYSVSDYMGSDQMYDDIVEHGLIEPEIEILYEEYEEIEDDEL